MKRSKIIVTMVASAAITLSLVSTAFAAPATPAKNCPTKNLLNQLIGSGNAAGTNGSSVPATGSSLPSNIQSLLGQYGLNGTPGIPGTDTGTGTIVKKNCPKSQVQQQPNGLPSSGSTAPVASPAPATSPSTGSDNTSSTPVNDSMSADEQKMIDLVNQDRATNGLPALTFDATLRAGALAHSQDMAENNYFSHTSPTQGDFSARLAAAGINRTAAGENIAKYGSVESAEVGFMNSPGHRANILGDYTRVGIGIVNVSGMYYITQWFAK